MSLLDRQLRAYDFASVKLGEWASDRFSIEKTNTLSLGRLLREFHDFDLDAALVMVKRLEGTSVKLIRRFISDMPGDWLTADEGESLCGDWEAKRGARLAALSAGLTDGSLL
jgi:hypothetical protein